MDDSYRALYAIYFQTLYQLDPGFNSNVEQLRPSVSNAEALAVPSIKDAIERLGSDKRSHLHAAAPLAWQVWAYARGIQGDSVGPDAQRTAGFLERLGGDVSSARSAPTMQAAFISPLREHNYNVRNFWVRSLFHPGTGATAGAAGIEVERPVTAFLDKADPRTWQKTAPQMFESSYRIGSPPLDFDADPDDADQAEGAGAIPYDRDWGGLIWEQCNLSAGAADLLLRNALRVKVTSRPPKPPLPPVVPPVTPPRGKSPPRRKKGAAVVALSPTAAPTAAVNGRRLKYSLYESITHDFSLFGGEAAGFGGLDCDSGFFDVREVPNDSHFTSVSAKKSLRFTGELAWLNSINQAGMLLWLTLATFSVACYNDQPGVL
jgi:hypothetical protein